MWRSSVVIVTLQIGHCSKIMQSSSTYGRPEDRGEGSALVVRKGQPDDLQQIVVLHLAVFEGFFLSFLGPAFLRILYKQMLESDVGVLLVCDEGGRIVGFVGGVSDQAGFYSNLVRLNKWGFAWAAFGAVLRRPSIAPRLVRALKRPGEAKESAAAASLMSIGVDPAMEGRGIGRSLVEAFCVELRTRGCPAVCLTTDKVNNARANRFYQSLDFVLSRQYMTPEGREMCEYLKPLA